ncbi:MAG TPA: hypothetical protein VEY92_08560 [Pseudoxanthomonas sp.]|nr:hypothetical protein [Pseudoxanthomonas sp.]
MRPSFADCVIAAACNDEYVADWMRLRGIRAPRAPIDRMIDEQTGYSEHVAQMFLDDVYNLIYSRIPLP